MAQAGRTRTLVLATLGALLVFWLQPWQGAVLVLIVFAVEALLWRRTRERPPLALLAIPVAAAIPAVYYFILSHADASWKLASKSNAAGVQPLWSWPWWAIVLTMGPLILPAALAYRLPSPTWQDIAVRAWPIGALVVYLMPIGTFPYHAIQGVAAAALHPRRPGRGVPGLAAAAGARGGGAALLTVPGSRIHKVGLARTNIHGLPLLRAHGRGTGARRARARPAPRGCAGGGVRKQRDPLPDGTGGLRGRALLVARVGGAGA